MGGRHLRASTAGGKKEGRLMKLWMLFGWSLIMIDENHG